MCGNQVYEKEDRVSRVEKAYVYLCPFCNGESLSKTRKGQIDHRSVCGNQIYRKEVASAERRGAMPTRARCVELLNGHPVRSERFTSNMTGPLGNHARKRNGTSLNRKRMKNDESRALAVRVAPCGKRVRKASGTLACPDKKMAGACGCESCVGKVCGRVLKPQKQMAGAWRVAARAARGFGGFEGGQLAGLNALKNRWLGRVAARRVWRV